MSTKQLTKPSKDFPLTATSNGYWVKKIRGKQHRIGDRWSPPAEALKEWLRVKDHLLAGDDPRPDPNALRLKDAMNHFLCDRERRWQSGEIVQRSYKDYIRECRRVVEVLGANTIVGNLTPEDFAKVKASISGTSPHTVAGVVTRIRVAFRYLYDVGLIDKPMRFGPSFKKPTAKTMRIYRQSQPKKLFSAADLRVLVVQASPQLKCAILLAINCGFGNSDCRRFTIDRLDLLGGWHDYARPKSGIERKAWLFPETVAALWPIVGDRRSGNVFVTSRGAPWAETGYANPTRTEFRTLARGLGIQQTFYAIRHTFATISSAAKDQIATDCVMGHVQAGQAATYREEISDDRIRAVCEVVREWYLK